MAVAAFGLDNQAIKSGEPLWLTQTHQFVALLRRSKP